MQFRPFLIKIKLKLKALAVKYRPQLRPVAIGEFYKRHWHGASPNADYLCTRVTPRFFFTSSNKEVIAETFARRFTDSASAIISNAEQIIAHRFELLGSGVTDLGKEIDWHSDFKSGFSWPIEHYSKLRIVDLSNSADVKLPWELSRLQFLTTLSQAYWLTNDNKYVDEFTQITSHWEKQNPVDIGVNWTCSMEIAIRAINIIWALYFFANSTQLSQELIMRLIRLLYYHAVHIENNLETIDKGSNTNHLLSNYLGLFYIGLLFPEFDRSKIWLEMGRDGLEKEMILQVNSDGVNYECSLSYHRLVLEIFLSAYLLGSRNEISFSAEYQERLKRMIEFSAAMSSQSGSVPAIGDNDDGFIIKLGNDNPHDHRALVDIGAQLFDIKIPEDITASPERLWYLGPESLNRWPKMSHRKSKLYKESGYAIIQTEQTHLTFNACNISEKGFGGHKHNDLLSVNLEINSVPFLIDTGTACYTSNYNLRNSSRMSSAHNTITIDDEEQNRFMQKALFFMYKDARAKIDLWTVAGDKVIVSGWHDGYKRFGGNIVHRRTIECALNERRFEIRDEITGDSTKRHLIMCSYLTPFDCRLNKDNLSVLINSTSVPQLRVAFKSESNLKIKTEPACYYPRYGVSKPATRLVCMSRTTLPFNVVTKIDHNTIPDLNDEFTLEDTQSRLGSLVKEIQ